jgi:hypothetical protein
MHHAPVLHNAYLDRGSGMESGASDRKFCEHCGASIDARAVICTACGVPIGSFKRFFERDDVASDRSRLVALLFA